MYIDLGANAVISDKSVIGIFDLDSSTVSKKTRDFLSAAEKNGDAVTVSLSDLPRSFTVTAENKTEQKIYISTMSVQYIIHN